ncbi:MAG: SDR family oxidoreductase [Rhodospirillales bacterium]|jgi:3-oxoacyl-[acyl-carrier protein] reductase
MAKTNKTALITGSGRNIGRGCAVHLATMGFNVVVNGSSNKSNCERVADEVRAAGTEAMIAMADCGDQTAVEEMAADAIRKFGRIDVLIHNAAIRPGTPFLEMSDADLDAVMRVNTYAAVWLSRAVLPGMVDAGWGRIINFTGMNAQRGSGGRPHVTMSKHAVVGLTKALAREFGPKGITSNVISPGTFPGEGENAAHSGNLEKLKADVPVGRLGEADDIAALVAYLCGPHGGFVNGQLLQVNGGVEM